ncbi:MULTISPECIES: motility protein A [Anaerotruncus]|jgi:chemotaxis protein MotA|uniref:Motility protein A n=1 Tax=Anaerotruncus colihominis TaxID=169435 RepID=A0A845RI72_9FIRM|nr:MULTISPECIES: MotA/TolQ/ExbB proton channel family protein [Anaerotruncus]MCI8492898.1 motility protein A [Anaerotruncus sp.]MCR2024324.1 MotA/TolQ/ExbB proton channel family protein [Anaerotruncus colihominis]NBI77462.1 motility protein A [Anaerotruncus colihominis]NDO39129.1 motility protein A [Anaerotruncus colihominis]
MDFLSVLGWLGGIGVILFGILFDKDKGIVFDNLKNFFDASSVMVVLGGVIVALMVSFPFSIFKKIPRHLKIILFPTKFVPQDYISQIVELATEARINGLLSLESKLQDDDGGGKKKKGKGDPFLRNSMMLIVDAVDPEKVKTLLETELDYLDERHAQDRAFYDKASAYAPAFGMIGTLMGLINLLKQLDDPNAIAPAMALALVTTFYGTILANLIFTPISNKLRVRHEEEYLCKMIVAEGVQAIQAGDNPKFIEEKLTQLIPGFLAAKGLSGKKGKKGKKEE